MSDLTEQQAIEAVEASLTDQYFTRVVPAEDRAETAEASLGTAIAERDALRAEVEKLQQPTYFNWRKALQERDAAVALLHEWVYVTDVVRPPLHITDDTRAFLAVLGGGEPK